MYPKYKDVNYKYTHSNKDIPRNIRHLEKVHVDMYRTLNSDRDRDIQV